MFFFPRVLHIRRVTASGVSGRLQWREASWPHSRSVAHMLELLWACLYHRRWQVLLAGNVAFTSTAFAASLGTSSSSSSRFSVDQSSVAIKDVLMNHLEFSLFLSATGTLPGYGWVSSVLPTIPRSHRKNGNTLKNRSERHAKVLQLWPIRRGNTSSPRCQCEWGMFFYSLNSLE